jgi:sugar lactone lactonase YvrE
MRFEAELLIDCRNDLGETPVWCARTQTLFWIDVTAPGRVFYWHKARAVVDFYQFEDLVTGLARRASGELLVVGSRDVFEFDRASESTQHVYSLPGDQPDYRFNDGGCDRAGRLWVGSMQNNFLENVQAAGSLEACGRIYTVRHDGNSRFFEAHLACPNGMCWSPDDATFYVADSVNGWIYAYDFDLTAGQIDNRREFCRFDDLGIPDGAAVDQEGYIWNARWAAGAVVRISPAGQIDRIVKVPTTNPTACCFGDSNMDTLYVTTARYGLTSRQLVDERFAGGIFALVTDVPGIEKAAFGG